MRKQTQVGTKGDKLVIASKNVIDPVRAVQQYQKFREAKIDLGSGAQETLQPFGREDIVMVPIDTPQVGGDSLKRPRGSTEDAEVEVVSYVCTPCELPHSFHAEGSILPVTLATLAEDLGQAGFESRTGMSTNASIQAPKFVSEVPTYPSSGNRGGGGSGSDGRKEPPQYKKNGHNQNEWSNQKNHSRPHKKGGKGQQEGVMDFHQPAALTLADAAAGVQLATPKASPTSEKDLPSPNQQPSSPKVEMMRTPSQH